ncbi:TetR/AcrR family transcriptional regulator [Fontisphaera persica]|uniref:TetR/AcrR family transcriptional regulator n=1 Tax=Fontisphaera persica TaxID=2974023 RepID=UPI0024C0E469|nr:TetR/AcrR family transcriptional regulator [Fontisphaera persica]WCJ59081.1 TetR/AcrR family transcriptional regulator [Fontisphaera persica]
MPERKNLRRDPQNRILDAAEAAFAELGYEGASLRDIVARAKVNLPTVYYYFRSKEGLLEAVFRRRFGPLREEHYALLQEKEARAGDRPLAVEEVLEAMLLPPLRMAARGGQSPVVMRLIGRIVSDPSSRTQAMLRQLHHDVKEEFLRRLARACPHLSREELGWRVIGLWGALGYLLAHPQRVLEESGGQFDLRRTDQALPRLVAFFAAALQSPPVRDTGGQPPAGGAR